MKKIERIARQFRNALDAAWEDEDSKNWNFEIHFTLLIVGFENAKKHKSAK